MFGEEAVVSAKSVNALLHAVGLDLNQEKRERLKILFRRAAWLKQRIANASKEGKFLQYDEDEAMATEWAVHHIIILEEEIKRLRGEIADLKKGGGGK